MRMQPSCPIMFHSTLFYFNPVHSVPPPRQAVDLSYLWLQLVNFSSSCLAAIHYRVPSQLFLTLYPLVHPSNFFLISASSHLFHLISSPLLSSHLFHHLLFLLSSSLIYFTISYFCSRFLSSHLFSSQGLADMKDKLKLLSVPTTSALVHNLSSIHGKYVGLSIYLFIYLIYPSIYISIYLSIYRSDRLSVYVCVCVCPLIIDLGN